MEHEAPKSDYWRLKQLNAAAGIALSLALHGMLAAWLWNRMLPAYVADHRAPRVLEVRLAPPLQPAPPPAVAQQPPLEARTRTVLRTALRTPKPIALQAAAPSSTTQSEPATPTASNQPAAEKHLDLAAVHASIGAIVAEVDREKRDTPVGQLQAKPLYAPESETKLGRDIARGARGDCKDLGNQFGLLAPLAMLMDRKNSGCKW